MVKKRLLLVILLGAGCASEEAIVKALKAAPTRIEMHPERLEIPVGADRDVHVEVFAHDTLLVPVEVGLRISEGGDVAAIQQWSPPFVTVRGLQSGEAELTVTVAELVATVPVHVVGES